MNPSATVSIEDFNSLKSTVEAYQEEMRKMMAQLLANTKATTPPPEIPNASSESDSKENLEEEELGVEDEDGDEDPIKPKTSSSPKGKGGKPEYGKVPYTYSVDPPIPHPHINLRGDPPKLDTTMFANWQFLMTSYLDSACIELWRIIQEGFKAHDPNNLTRREVVDKQLNATALHMIHVAVGEKNMPHIQHLTTAKEAWKALSDEFVGNESMKRNRFEALSNQAEGFYMEEGEGHEDMYRRLKTIANTFRALGASHVDDAWIKRKYVSSLMPFESADLKTLQGRHNYHTMTSNEVMQEMQAFKVAAKNAEDSRARAIGMSKGVSHALKAKVVTHEEEEEGGVDKSSTMSDKEKRDTLHEHLALAARNYWKSPYKAKINLEQHAKSSSGKDGGGKMRTCYNCQDRYHFVKDCPFENREEHGGKLIRKDSSKMTKKKPYFNKKPTKRMVLVAEEEYSSGSEDEEEDTTSAMAAVAIASSTPSSLFDSPNENAPIQATCLMAKGPEVHSHSSPKTMHDMDDPTSLKVKEEMIAFETFLANLQGETKRHFETIMSQYGEALELLEQKGKIEREDANEKANLTIALSEEQDLRISLEEKLVGLEEAQNKIVSQIIKERDLAHAKYKALKKEKVEFGVDLARLTSELEKLEKAHKALESEHFTLLKSQEQLQIQLTKNDKPSTSTPTCDHTIMLEENARLKDELAKASITQGEKRLGKPHIGKEGLGYVAKAKKKKKNKKKKTNPAQAKKNTIVSGEATRGNTTPNDFAGKANPHYVLFRDYYGDVYAKYVGPFDGLIEWSIWVPKTLVTNKRGPIAKWVPKTKQ